MPDVQIRLGAVVGDEDLAVLERIHRAGVDIEVRVQLLHGDPKTAEGEKPPEAGRRQTLAEARGDTAGDEEMLGRT
ncbi:hypothetical protein GCM10010402_74800 [Actinomadura luteofluorescens]